MLLVNRSALVEENTVEAFHQCPLLSWFKISNSFMENNNVVVFPFPFQTFVPLANLLSIRLQE
jgi:hypothetical protein